MRSAHERDGTPLSVAVQRQHEYTHRAMVLDERLQRALEGGW